MTRPQHATAGLLAAEAKMRAAGVSEVGVRAFARLYGMLARGDRGLLAGADLEPVADVPSLGELDVDGAAADALDRTVIVKLNGGLGTTMGLSGPKSLVEVKPGVTFLDVIARQVLAARRRWGARLPLVLMSSFATRAPSHEALRRHPGLAGDLPADFLQHRQPRLRARDLWPVELPGDPQAEWCPPGHGDLYAALLASGMLAAMLARGYRYAFVANADNLGAVVEPGILAWISTSEIPFLMEVVQGTAADRKGGHIALRDGRLVLRDTAQAAGDASFTDFARWRFYNSNNLWIDLVRLGELLEAHDGVLPLALIVNRKTIAPAEEVLQLETAMGSAVGLIEGARAVHVPRTRFAPVKSTDDLVLVRSDVYELTEDARLLPAAGVASTPVVELDPEYYGSLGDLAQRFPSGPPGLRRCTRLRVEGDVVFGRDVVIVGDVELQGPARIADGTVLGGSRAG
jgi:UTP--glucose-1-phosphate uridylyltransferase